MRVAFLSLLIVGACGTFEDPSIVIDLRPLAIVADPPEQLIPYDPTKPPDPTTIHLAPVEICALIADPGAARSLEFTMTACPDETDGRCDPDKPSVLVGGGTIDDPETAPTRQPACARLEANAALFAVVRQAVIDDPLGGFGQVDVMVQLRVNEAGAPPDQAIWAGKDVRFGAKVPAARTPNQNPTLTEIQWRPVGEDGPIGDGMPLPLGRCAEGVALELGPEDTIELTPIEPAGARETYLVPTFDGGITTITENLSYDWLAGAGNWDASSTGGPRDGFGNEPDLYTQWTAPPADKIGDGKLIPIYVVQRDERLGQAWYESCVHVHP
jgi:hypothetical protein